MDKGHFNLLHNLNIFDQYPFLWKSKFYKYFWNTFFPPYHRRHLQSKSACLCSKRFGVILLLLIPLSEHWACPHCEQVIYSCLSDNSYSLVTVERWRGADLRAWTRLRSENSCSSTKAFRVWRWSSSLWGGVWGKRHETKEKFSPFPYKTYPNLSFVLASSRSDSTPFHFLHSHPHCLPSTAVCTLPCLTHLSPRNSPMAVLLSPSSL